MDDALPPDSRFRLSGLYDVNVDGTLQIPFLEPQPAVGLEVVEVQKKLAEALVSKGYFRAESLELSVSVVSWAPIQVTVAGDTFRPGRVLINAAAEQRSGQEGQTTLAGDVLSGSYAPDRYLSTAIRAAGGLKPSADLQHIRLLRGKQERRLTFRAC